MILKEICFKPTSFHGMLQCDGLMASDFITPSCRWDVAKLKRYVMLADVNLICTIPISTTNEEGKWLWHYDSKGNYSVKSGYKLAMIQFVWGQKYIRRRLRIFSSLPKRCRFHCVYICYSVVTVYTCPLYTGRESFPISILSLFILCLCAL